MIQLVASFLTCLALSFIITMQILTRRSLDRVWKIHREIFDHLNDRLFRMGQGWAEMASVIDEQSKRIEMQEQRIANLEARFFTMTTVTGDVFDRPANDAAERLLGSEAAEAIRDRPSE